MCGINCILDLRQRQPNKSSLVRRMNRDMVYRGPDDEGTFDDECIAMSMRRLSIIDTEGGHQPLYNEDHSLVLICNGEIYNFLELRRALEAKGHKFSSCSDSEVILHLYEETDADCLHDLRGMFAFILWDRKRKRFFVARDRVGIKPLYYFEDEGVLWFSSELKAIVTASSLSPTIDPQAVWQYLIYGFPIDKTRTVVKEIRRVMPGEYMIADNEGTEWRSYWHPRFGERGGNNVSDSQLLQMLEEAVRIHLRSDVPVGILLSGGIDSAAISAMAARSGRNFEVLCVGYAGSFQVDEREEAHATAEILNLPYRDLVLDENDFSTKFNMLINCCDEPVADPSAAAQWALYEAARDKGIKVLLSGIGGDELFFGYDGWNKVGMRWARKMPNEAAGKKTLMEQIPPYYFSGWLLRKLALPSFFEYGASSDKPLYDLQKQVPPGPDAVYAILFGTYLLNNGLILADKLGMGCSVEVRVPFVDHVLIESILALPLSRHFAVGETKVLLRRLLAEVLPLPVLQRPKKGFSVPTNYLKYLVARDRSTICNGLLSSAWLNRDLLVSLFPKEIKQKNAVNDTYHSILRRAFKAFHAAGFDRIAFRFSPYAATEFLYRILFFELWWQSITRPRSGKNLIT